MKAFLVLLLSCSSLLFADSRVISTGKSEDNSLEHIFLTLEQLSPNTQRRLISTEELSPPLQLDLKAFTRIRRRNSNGHYAYGNATLIAADQCHWIAAAAGHSVLDHRFNRLAPRSQIEVQIPDGSWINPEEIRSPEGLHWQSDEIDDWALLVLLAPRCQFNDQLQFGEPLIFLPTQALNSESLEQCTHQLQMYCFHYDQGRAQGQQMLEQNCTMRLQNRGLPGSTGYMSCKVNYGVSGCAPVCVTENGWLNLGVFSKGLKRHHTEQYPQQVGAFRVMDGELAAALLALKMKYFR